MRKSGRSRRSISRAFRPASASFGDWPPPTDTPGREPSSAGATLRDEPLAKRRKPPREPEHRAQVALVRWAALTRVPHFRGSPASDVDPADTVADHLIAIPNGGLRTPRTAGRLKAEGVKAGTWDLFVPLGRLGYLGLWIETKSDVGDVSPSQRDFREKRERAGYATLVYRENWGLGAEAILAYLRADEAEFNSARERAACKPSSKKSRT
jgi:hypothetical protein